MCVHLPTQKSACLSSQVARRSQQHGSNRKSNAFSRETLLRCNWESRRLLALHFPGGHSIHCARRSIICARVCAVCTRPLFYLSCYLSCWTFRSRLDPTMMANAHVAAVEQDSLAQQEDLTPSPNAASVKKALTRPRAMKRCTAPACESFARSRGFCKAHGGGKRCKQPGCMLSDQGGGFCIRHGGGKRCETEGCQKSAQSRRFCKAHGGGVRCKVEGCQKTSQGGGCCRTHGGGPRPQKKSKLSTSSIGTSAVSFDAAANDTIATPSQSSTPKKPRRINGQSESANTPSPEASAPLASVGAAKMLEDSIDPRAFGSSASPCSPVAVKLEKVESPRILQKHALAKRKVVCEAHYETKSPLAFKILPLDGRNPQYSAASADTLAASTEDYPDAPSGTEKCAASCRVGGCRKQATSQVTQLCAEHSTNLSFAASLLGMLSAES